jgi:hypothetical protein
VPVIRNNGNTFGDRLAEHTSELDNRKEITRIQPRLVTTASLKKAHILPYSYIINEKTLSAFDDSMAQDRTVVCRDSGDIYLDLRSNHGLERLPADGNSPK